MSFNRATNEKGGSWAALGMGERIKSGVSGAVCSCKKRQPIGWARIGEIVKIVWLHCAFRPAVDGNYLKRFRQNLFMINAVCPRFACCQLFSQVSLF